ncbi:hypothetical protein L665_03721 [Ralstonia solanacearum SD54]|nr:DeoR family transcriptional regulator [Ralstonia solanacearum]ESS47338.1 hypothetical protein L665_03721 [Ralstonia solanacearum SD54]
MSAVGLRRFRGLGRALHDPDYPIFTARRHVCRRNRAWPCLPPAGHATCRADGRSGFDDHPRPFQRE